ncbi:MAG: sugar phosphate nucleotidyltransferase [Syntrophobacteraceae bacterium]
MQAMILSAGLGTRLLPLTLVRPKVLVPLRGIPILDFWVDRFHSCGFEAALLNAFHLSGKLGEAVEIGKWPIPLKVLNEPVLLGTGGGIKGALEFCGDEPLAVINGDIICNLPLDAFYDQHVRSGAEVSLVLHDWPEFNNVAVDQDGAVLGFGKDAEVICRNDPGIRKLAFTGIHFINPSALRDLPAGIPGEILDSYRKLILRGNPPRALFHKELYWREMGSIESYKNLTRELGLIEPDYLPPLLTGRTICMHPETVVSTGCELSGSVVTGRGVHISEGVRLENVILWDNVRIDAGSYLKDCIVADGMRISGIHSNKVLAPAMQ